MIEVNAEDQYAVVSGEVTLEAVLDALPTGLVYRAPRLALPLEDWLLSGGVGVLNAPPLRADVLGLTYRGAHGAVAVGGIVVKNVSGYDLRLVIASDPALERRVRIERAVLRLRPGNRLEARDQRVSEAELGGTFAALHEVGALYAYAARVDDAWLLRAEFEPGQARWGEPASDAFPRVSRDALGVFPRVAPQRSALESALLESL